MKKTKLIATCLVFIFSLAYSGEIRFASVNECFPCHFGIKKGLVYEKWKEGPHAKAFETLKTVGEEKNPQCLECHTTGFNAGGYQVSEPYASDFEGIQCESCHGPGAIYKTMSIMKNKKRALVNGMIDPTEDVCRKCHNKKSPGFIGFDYKKFYAAIDHVYRKK